MYERLKEIEKRNTRHKELQQKMVHNLSLADPEDVTTYAMEYSAIIMATVADIDFLLEQLGIATASLLEAKTASKAREAQIHHIKEVMEAETKGQSNGKGGEGGGYASPEYPPSREST